MSERTAVAWSGGTDALGFTVVRTHYDDGTVEEHRARARPGVLVIVPRPGV
jgi:hypothetical protein